MQGVNSEHDVDKKVRQELSVAKLEEMKKDKYTGLG